MLEDGKNVQSLAVIVLDVFAYNSCWQLLISIQNLKFVAKQMASLCFAGIWTLLGLACDWSEFGQKNPTFLQMVNMNFHAQSQVCRSKNDWVMEVGTKEDTIVLLYLSYIYLSYTSK